MIPFLPLEQAIAHNVRCFHCNNLYSSHKQLWLRSKGGDDVYLVLVVCTLQWERRWYSYSFWRPLTKTCQTFLNSYDLIQFFFCCDIFQDQCDANHARLFSRDPDSYFDISSSSPSSSFTRKPSTVKWDRNDVMGVGSGGASLTTTSSSLNDFGNNKDPAASLWSLNMFNRILIFPGTKWCGQGSVAEEYSDIGYHAEADRCCR